MAAAWLIVVDAWTFVFFYKAVSFVIFLQCRLYQSFNHESRHKWWSKDTTHTENKLWVNICRQLGKTVSEYLISPHHFWPIFLVVLMFINGIFFSVLFVIVIITSPQSHQSLHSLMLCPVLDITVDNRRHLLQS